MLNSGTITAREALLGSLLFHACVIIYILLFPETFLAGGAPLATSRDGEHPIPLEFLPSEAVEPDADRMNLADAGDRNRSDPRPESAPPPENEDPYAEGNTRNRFVAPPVPPRRPPAPDPGGGAAGLLGAPSPDEGGRAEAADDPGDGDRDAAADPTAGERTRFIVPAPGRGGPGRDQGSRRSIREALGRMSTGLSGSGGAPLKYDNPVGGLSTPSGGLSFDTPGFNWGPYARKIYWIIWSNWVRGWPPAARAGLAGMVTVRFRIHRDGTISAIQVLEPSGAEGFDTCATLALEASSPLPPLPDDYPGGESEGVTARFLYNLERPPR